MAAAPLYEANQNLLLDDERWNQAKSIHMRHPLHRSSTMTVDTHSGQVQATFPTPLLARGNTYNIDSHNAASSIQTNLPPSRSLPSVSSQMSFPPSFSLPIPPRDHPQMPQVSYGRPHGNSPWSNYTTNLADKHTEGLTRYYPSSVQKPSAGLEFPVRQISETPNMSMSNARPRQSSGFAQNAEPEVASQRPSDFTSDQAAGLAPLWATQAPSAKSGISLKSDIFVAPVPPEVPTRPSALRTPPPVHPVIARSTGAHSMPGVPTTPSSSHRGSITTESFSSLPSLSDEISGLSQHSLFFSNTPESQPSCSKALFNQSPQLALHKASHATQRSKPETFPRPIMTSSGASSKVEQETEAEWQDLRQRIQALRARYTAHHAPLGAQCQPNLTRPHPQLFHDSPSAFHNFSSNGPPRTPRSGGTQGLHKANGVKVPLLGLPVSLLHNDIDYEDGDLRLQTSKSAQEMDKGPDTQRTTETLNGVPPSRSDFDYTEAEATTIGFMLNSEMSLGSARSASSYDYMSSHHFGPTGSLISFQRPSIYKSVEDVEARTCGCPIS